MVRALGEALALASGLGIPLAVLVSCGALLGHHLDKKLGSAPWLLLLGTVLGAAGALMNALRILERLQSREAVGKPPARSAADERPRERETDDARAHDDH